jgi:hypothetical protein
VRQALAVVADQDLERIAGPCARHCDHMPPLSTRPFPPSVLNRELPAWAVGDSGRVEQRLAGDRARRVARAGGPRRGPPTQAGNKRATGSSRWTRAPIDRMRPADHRTRRPPNVATSTSRARYGAAVLWYETLLWGCFGGMLVVSLDFVSVISRTGNYPWKSKKKMLLGPYVAATMVRLAVGGGLAVGIGQSGALVANPLAAITIGIATPLIVEKLTQAGLDMAQRGGEIE